MNTKEASINTSYFKVRDMLLDLGYSVSAEYPDENVLVVDSEVDGIKNLVIACGAPLLIMEQFLVRLQVQSEDIYRQLLQKNRDLIHGALVLDENADRLIFRDTLEVENLDPNELEGSIQALSLLLSEYAEELIRLSQLN